MLEFPWASFSWRSVRNKLSPVTQDVFHLIELVLFSLGHSAHPFMWMKEMDIEFFVA